MKIQNREVNFSHKDEEHFSNEILQRTELVNAELDIQNDNTGISLFLLVAV